MAVFNLLTRGHAFMRRALELSLMGGPQVSPNPFVGAVIVADGRIIGEGFHRRFGEAHAEVNAVNSVREADRALLREATMYVTLEPCSHFGKTPPCADLIIREGLKRVVVAHEDPFLKDFESGIDKLRRAGIEVEVGLMREQARWINRRFFTAHELKRPYVLLKWARSADGFIAAEGGRPVRLSSPFTRMLMHRERAFYDAIMVGVDTILVDNPRLNCRLWPCRTPESRPARVTFSSPRLPASADSFIKMAPGESLQDFLHRLYSDFKLTSLMVEGGTKSLESFISSGFFDEIREETAAVNLGRGVPAPSLSHLHLPLLSESRYGDSRICSFTRSPLLIGGNDGSI